MKSVQLTIDEEVLNAVDTAVRGLGTSRSAFLLRILPTVFIGMGLLLGCAAETPTLTPPAVQSPPSGDGPGDGVMSTPPADVTTIPAEPTADSSSSVIETTATIESAVTTEPEVVAQPSATIRPTLAAPIVQEYEVPLGSRPHDVAPAPDGSVWYTAQGSGELGRLDPNTGTTEHIPLGAGSAPHGVIVGPDGAPWVTDSGLNAIVRLDPVSEEVTLFPLPAESGNANLNTATFDAQGVLWFTGQNGVYGRLDPASGLLDVFNAPGGRGPYGVATTPTGEVYYVSLAGSHMARIDLASGQAEVLEPPTPGQGARRVWSDSQGRLWVSEWNVGQVARYDPATGTWQEWPLPGDSPLPYAVYVDEQDQVWLSDFGANALVRFDPVLEEFTLFTLPSSPANVRQILGRPGEVWGAESGVDRLVVIRTQ